jgi:hypothetical protein
VVSIGPETSGRYATLAPFTSVTQFLARACLRFEPGSAAVATSSSIIDTQPLTPNARLRHLELAVCLGQRENIVPDIVRLLPGLNSLELHDESVSMWDASRLQLLLDGLRHLQLLLDGLRHLRHLSIVGNSREVDALDPVSDRVELRVPGGLETLKVTPRSILCVSTPNYGSNHRYRFHWDVAVRLRTLYIDTETTFGTAARMSVLRALLYLSLCGAALDSEERLHECLRLPSLTRLSLNNFAIKTAPPPFTQLNLQRLDLYHCNVPSASFFFSNAQILETQVQNVPAKNAYNRRTCDSECVLGTLCRLLGARVCVFDVCVWRVDWPSVRGRRIVCLQVAARIAHLRSRGLVVGDV